ncbi:MAG: tRNA (N6-isopentenyl adenosine(37)-C2)-methylthiotransferase MiaB, partial [Oscillospiraceae bacterium]|nr:tRNA (N6-isopentenyl adenosine(37)-C2)-methylthiotransferase MiaB [Oscillospiraceae bacterium]
MEQEGVRGDNPYADAVTALFAERDSPPLCFVRTFGCRQNVSDGEKIAGVLNSLGCGFTEDLSFAAIVVYNTCAVRENAQRRVFGLLGGLKHLKDVKKDVITAVCGCMTEQGHVREEIREKHKYVDLLFGTDGIGELPRLLYELLFEKKASPSGTFKSAGTIDEGLPVLRKSRFKADVPVMFGCDNFCGYCVVPYVRGRERSREPRDIIAEVAALAADGCKEIMLLGQNVNSYGKGLAEEVNFPALLRSIDGLDGDFKIRFRSPHPKDAGKELIDAIAECGKVCKHLHLPVQSGSDRVLREMNRGYTIGQYLEIVRYSRVLMPGFSMSTDVLVGYPNETYDDFKRTLDVLEYVKFDNIFSFIYSKREGTKAAGIEDKTPEADKSAWFAELLRKQREIAAENNKRFVGKTLEVLFDAEKDGFISGKSDEFMTVAVPGASGDFLGRREPVVITKARIS